MAALMLQGTGSDVGKSLLVAGLCRAFAQRGINVAPFKPQNMSNNAGVAEGGEIGRAQWLQAFAANVVPSVHMNPVLLKPEGHLQSQLIVQGKRRGLADASYFRKERTALMGAVMESFSHLQREHDLVLVEGAGSPAEVNLREGDIANMGFARAANVPVILAGDIDRGGVIASLVGTHTVISPEDRAMIHGFLINKFRGELSLFDDGLKAITKHTGWPCFGVVPYHAALRGLPQEDAMAILSPPQRADAHLKIVVPRLPHLANFDDLDPLLHEPDVELRWLEEGEALPACDLVILLGSKCTIADLEVMRARGWHVQIAQHAARGGHVLGICGGYQMLGRMLHDPHHVESKDKSSAPGLGLLNVDTMFGGEKIVRPWQGICAQSGIAADGYEIHLGKSDGADTARPFFVGDGACSQDGRVCGTYVHGLFASDAYRAQFLSRYGAKASPLGYRQRMNEILDEWAALLSHHLDMNALLTLATSQAAPSAQAVSR